MGNRFSSFLVAFLILQLLNIQSFCVKAEYRKHPKAYPKIGTWEKASVEFWYTGRLAKDLEQRHISTKKHKELRDDFFKDFKPHLLPPRKYGTFPIASKYLGTFSYVMKMPLWYDHEAIDSISRKYDQIVRIPYIGVNRSGLNYRHQRTSPPEYQLQDQSNSQASGPSSPRSQSKRSSINNSILTKPLTGISLPVRNITIHNEQLGHRPPGSRSKRNNEGDGLEGWDPDIENVENAFPDMVRLSLPPGVEYDEYMPAWRWKNAGKGVKVYVIDSGCDTRHPEFEEANIEDWIYGTHDILKEPRDYYTSTFNDNGLENMAKSHGTTVLSKIVGKRVGVAPKADIIMVQNAPTTNHEIYAGYTVVNSWLKTYDHVVDNRRKRNGKYCVVTSAIGIVFDKRLVPVYYEIFRHVVRSLGKMGCFVVVSAGNIADDSGNLGYSPLSTYPQLIAGDPEIEKNFIVVGGHSRSYKNMFQSNEFVKISAQGTGVATVRDLNMDENPPNGDWTAITAYSSSTGTSFAAPVVAGLLATFISRGYRDPVGYLYSLTKDPKISGQPRIAFNGIWPDMWPTALRPQGYKRPPENPTVSERTDEGLVHFS